MVAQRMIQEIKAKEMSKTYGPNKEAGEKFLAANAKKAGVKTLPSGVQYKVIKEGTGAIPADTSLVKVHYEGRLINDTIFDRLIQAWRAHNIPCQPGYQGLDRGSHSHACWFSLGSLHSSGGGLRRACSA